MEEKRKPIIVHMAEEVAARGANHLQQAAPFDWGTAYALAAGRGAEALAAVIEDVEWYGEETVSLKRLKRFHEALVALRDGGTE